MLRSAILQSAMRSAVLCCRATQLQCQAKPAMQNGLAIAKPCAGLLGERARELRDPAQRHIRTMRLLGCNEARALN
jgi:hypothetical protein